MLLNNYLKVVRTQKRGNQVG